MLDAELGEELAHQHPRLAVAVPQRATRCIPGRTIASRVVTTADMPVEVSSGLDVLHAVGVEGREPLLRHLLGGVAVAGMLLLAALVLAAEIAVQLLVGMSSNGIGGGEDRAG